MYSQESHNRHLYYSFLDTRDFRGSKICSLRLLYVLLEQRIFYVWPGLRWLLFGGLKRTWSSSSRDTQQFPQLHFCYSITMTRIRSNIDIYKYIDTYRSLICMRMVIKVCGGQDCVALCSLVLWLCRKVNRNHCQVCDRIYSYSNHKLGVWICVKCEE